MTSFRSGALLLSLISTLTGCYSITYQAFDKDANPTVKRIALLQVLKPKEVEVVNASGAGDVVAPAFGLTGRLVATAVGQSRTTSFTQALAAQKLDMGNHLTQTIEAELEKRGYDVTVVTNRPGVRDPGGEDKEVDYSHVNPKADAILHVWFTIARYYSPFNSPGYTPQLGVTARLVTTSDKSQLYCNRVAYEAGKFTFGNEPGEVVTASKQYTFYDFDSLLEKSNEAAQGLHVGVGEIGVRIAKNLSKPEPVAPPPPPPPPPPVTAAGFALGAPIWAAEATCARAGFVWQKLNDSQLSCSGAAADVGVPATVNLTTCAGLVCEVSVNGSPDGAAWGVLMERFDKLSKLLEGSHGAPFERETTPLDDCTEEVSQCLAAGRARRSALWRWPDRQGLRPLVRGVSLVLSGGPPAGPPKLDIHYYSPAYIDTKR